MGLSNNLGISSMILATKHSQKNRWHFILLTILQSLIFINLLGVFIVLIADIKYQDQGLDFRKIFAIETIILLILGISYLTLKYTLKLENIKVEKINNFYEYICCVRNKQIKFSKTLIANNYLNIITWIIYFTLTILSLGMLIFKNTTLPDDFWLIKKCLCITMVIKYILIDYLSFGIAFSNINLEKSKLNNVNLMNYLLLIVPLIVAVLTLLFHNLIGIINIKNDDSFILYWEYAWFSLIVGPTTYCIALVLTYISKVIVVIKTNKNASLKQKHLYAWLPVLQKHDNLN